MCFSFKCCHQSIHKRGRTSTIKRTKMRTNASDWHTNNTKCQMRTRWIAMEIENGLCLAIIRCRHRSKTTICSTIKTDFVLILFGCRKKEHKTEKHPDVNTLKWKLIGAELKSPKWSAIFNSNSSKSIFICDCCLDAEDFFYSFGMDL